MKRKQAVLVALVIALLALALAACGGSDDGAATASGDGIDATTASGGDEPTTIRYQTNAGIISPVEIAAKLGYLGKLQLKSVGPVLGGPEAIQAVATDQSDIGGAFNTAIAQLIASGGSVKAVVGFLGFDKDNFQGLYLLDDSSIHDAHDLIGKKIGVNTLGAGAEGFIKMWLKDQGLTPDEIDQVELVVIPPVNAEQALREGQLDSVDLSGPLLDLAKSKGGIREVATDVELLGDYTGNSLVLRNDFIEDHPEATSELVAGIAKAIVFLQTAPRAEVIKTATEAAAENGRPDDKESLKFWKSNGVSAKGGVLQKSDFTVWINWLEEEGQLEKGELKLDDVYTNEFNPFYKAGSPGAAGGGE